ncbi:M14 family metallopeptidase [Sinomicrobium weinanense]|uniref:Peptidase M14 n=1 Tax=Sinomicrobium weinanense TaxID=2842200 RepID=A0A926JWA2_9FLAO|nr:M14 metallopeptidase family protein [Sinomicrobium weinanense]MBC9798348.1 peptidase M14 [Sinomicrobium weinanense]MBU3122505.1 peptidase M14 [Sinomicrobium weinanense]
MELAQWHDNNRERNVNNRYIILDDIEPLLKKYRTLGELSIAGYSVEDRPIYLFKTGRGPKKVLMWSQMHGNESTTTKAVMDLLALLDQGGEVASAILDHCTIYIIPMLNPDGARAYTRVNANGTDLNRDAAKLSQPESLTLRHVFDTVLPDFCFNLHDQRTIFNTGNAAKPATLSFLSPATDEERNITLPRKKSMEIIAVINNAVQKFIPGQVGRYDDTFNINCVGDSFQSLGVPTLLFESGHFPEDYARDITRKYVFYALVTALQYIAENEVDGTGFNAYFDIPENNKLFFDILIRRFPFKEGGKIQYKDIGILYKEEPGDSKIEFVPYVSETGDLQGFYGHKEFDADDLEADPIEEKRLKTSELLKLFI